MKSVDEIPVRNERIHIQADDPNPALGIGSQALDYAMHTLRAAPGYENGQI
jgi:hypothetical protein